MTKLRDPLSVEKILKSIISKLKENEIEEFTGKSISHFRKCSDPDDKDHNLHLSDAIKLDVLSVKSQKGTPFLDHISLIINNSSNTWFPIKNFKVTISIRFWRTTCKNCYSYHIILSIN